MHNSHCRICRNTELEKILDMGEMPLANAFLKKEELDKIEHKFPLAAYYCEKCGLLQLLDIVNPEVLFRHYHYQTSTSAPLAEHFVELGRVVADNFIKSKDDLVIDIGGNDAVLLSSIKDKCRVLNVEPAKNIAEVAKGKGVDTIEDFFTKDLAERILKERGPARVITASNVVAHIDNLDDLFAGVKILIGEKGIFIFEVHWVANLLGLSGAGGFDQIYHEHLSYFSLMSLQKAASRFGFTIFDVQLIPIHGRSLRVFAGQNQQATDSIGRVMEEEKHLGLDKPETYLKFGENVERNKKELRELLLALKKNNKKIVGYGAPAKGNVLINFFGLDKTILDYLVDDSPLKHGLYTPGMHLPVFPSAKLDKDNVDYLLLLAWNYADSIMQKEKKRREGGTKFIIPVPEVKII